MPAYTVERITEGVPKGTYGNLSAYATLKDEGGLLCERVNLFMKKLPAVGETVRGSIEDSQYGPQFKREPPANGFGGNGPRPRDPKESAQIVRQHSQEMALRYAAIRQAQGKLDPEDFSLSALFKIADQFDRDAKAAQP